jgi:NitT/TauT family transport system substrate-binding protein
MYQHVARQRWNLGGIAAFLLLLAAMSARAEDAVKVSAFEGTFVNFPVYVARDLKLFEKHGIKAELVYGKGIQVANIMVSGATEFGAFAVEHGVTVAAKGQDVKLLVLNQTQPPFAVVVRKDVATPHASEPYPARLLDLKGRKIGISSVGASTDIAIRYMLSEAGLDPQSDVKIIPVGDPITMVAGLKNGVIDGLIAVEPAQIEAVMGQQIAKTMLDIEAGEGPELFREYAYNGLFVRQSYLQDHADLARRMVAAIVDAEIVINDPARIDDVMAVVQNNMRGLDPALLKGYVEHYRAIWRPIASAKAIDNVNKLLLAGKVIDTAVPYDKLVAADFMPRAFP